MRNWLFGGVAVSCLAVLASGVLGPVDAQQPPALVIQGGTLIDGNGGAPVPNSVIVIQGNRITAGGRAGQVQVPAGRFIEPRAHPGAVLVHHGLVPQQILTEWQAHGAIPRA